MYHYCDNSTWSRHPRRNETMGGPSPGVPRGQNLPLPDYCEPHVTASRDQLIQRSRISENLDLCKLFKKALDGMVRLVNHPNYSDAVVKKIDHSYTTIVSLSCREDALEKGWRVRELRAARFPGYPPSAYCSQHEAR